MNSIARSLLIRKPLQIWFIGSAVFHYLGSSFAVFLALAIGVFGVAWFSIATAALIFVPVARPGRMWRRAGWPERRLLIALGVCLAVTKCSFYLALDWLPLSLVAAMEFVWTVGLALVGLRTWRNAIALPLTVLGVLVLIDICWSSDLVGLALAFLNGALFVLPVCFAQAFSAAAVSALLLAGIGVGVCSSVFPLFATNWQWHGCRLPVLP
ncbi:MAG: hypothetical protein VX090_17085, partial [Pseudomonadota bacterium]|nr:hypothetical protein [Pseudomonadota bacterium]